MNSLSSLMRSAILVHPSLPSQSGIAKLLWCWVKPRIYDHLEWNPSEYNNLSPGCEAFFVAVLSSVIDTNDTHTELMQVPMESTEQPKYMKEFFNLNSEYHDDLVNWLLVQDKANLVQHDIAKNFALVANSNKSVQMKVAKALMQLCQQSTLHPALVEAFPNIVDGLQKTNPHVPTMAAQMIVKLSEYREFWFVIGENIPKIISLLHNQNKFVQRVGSHTLIGLSQQSELHSTIKKGIPDIANLLQNTDTQIISVDILAKLSAHDEFANVIQEVIPKIFHLLQDSNVIFRSAVEKLLIMLFKQSKSHLEIAKVLANIVNIVKSAKSIPHIQITGAHILTKLSAYERFEGEITQAIPEIINLLWNVNPLVQKAAADSLVKMSEHTKMCHVIKKAIPKIINQSESNAQIMSVDLLGRLSAHKNLHSEIEKAIPDIIALIQNVDPLVRKASADSLLDMFQHATLCSAIEKQFPQIKNLYNSKNNSVERADLAALFEQYETLKQPLHNHRSKISKVDNNGITRVQFECNFYTP